MRPDPELVGLGGGSRRPMISDCRRARAPLRISYRYAERRMLYGDPLLVVFLAASKRQGP